MMDSILFLHEHSSYKIEKQVFKDFNMLDMLGDDIVAVLSIPCNEDEILERQNIFKDLYDENFYNSLYTFRNHLAEMKRTKDILYSYDQNIGCFFIFAKYVRSYIDSIRSVYNVVSSSRLISQLYNAVDKYAEKFLLLDSLAVKRTKRLIIIHNRFALLELMYAEDFSLTSAGQYFVFGSSNLSNERKELFCIYGLKTIKLMWWFKSIQTGNASFFDCHCFRLGTVCGSSNLSKMPLHLWICK